MTRPHFGIGRRQALFADVYGKNPDHTDYAVHPSGRWFAMRRADPGGRDLVLVLNWFEELRGREAND